MQRLRSTWLALMGGALLVTLSVSAAFGAPPTGTDGPRGQTVAAFVHELVFGSDEETDDDAVVVEDEQEDEEQGSDEEEELTEPLVTEDEVAEEGEVADSHGECVSEEASTNADADADANHGAVVSEAAHTCPADEATEEVTDAEELVVETEREVPGEFANHGECVSDATDDTDGFEASEAANHGEWISEHARYICWSLPVPGDDVEETATEDEGDSAELSAQEERKAEQAAAKAERETARAAKAARTNGGRGSGRP